MSRFLTLFAAALTLLLLSPAARAQSVWLQIESFPTLSTAQSRAREWGDSFPNVNGFRLGQWYALALGPYTEAQAAAELGRLRSLGLIPDDAYIADTASYRNQFWPVGGTALTAAATPAAPLPQGTAATAEASPIPEVYVPDETRSEARRSESLLTADERKELQEVLQWEGFYNSAIDGAFGPGTRAAMSAYQGAMGWPVTGILTTGQRARLLGDYNAVFDRLGLAQVVDNSAGIEMILPLGQVSFAETTAPFVRYDPRNGSGMQVFLISQAGDEATLFGLYDILQTLEIIPVEGPRSREARSFEITGEASNIRSYTVARLEDGAIKGFIVNYPRGDNRVMEKVLDTMKESFNPIAGVVLPDNAGVDAGAEQSRDLLAGLQIRRPERSRTGVFVDDLGAVLTVSEAVDQCSRITLWDNQDMEVAARDEALGLVLLRPVTRLAPIDVAAFQPSKPRLASDIAVAGYSYGDLLESPSLTFGTLADLQGLSGETDVARLSVAVLEGDAGGPVFDRSGAVIGVLSPRESSARQLPDDVAFAVSVQSAVGFLTANGVDARVADAPAPLDPEDLSARAADMTVRISCWN